MNIYDVINLLAWELTVNRNSPLQVLERFSFECRKVIGLLRWKTKHLQELHKNLSRHGLTSKRIVNMEKSFNSHTELPGKFPSIRLLKKRKLSRKKTFNFYLESKIKSLQHIQARVPAILNTFIRISISRLYPHTLARLAHTPQHFRTQIESSPRHSRHMLLAEASRGQPRPWHG